MAEIKTEYIIIISKIKTERQGTAELSLRIEDADISDEELLKIKEIQKKAAKEMEDFLKKETPTESGRAVR